MNEHHRIRAMAQPIAHIPRAHPHLQCAHRLASRCRSPGSPQAARNPRLTPSPLPQAGEGARIPPSPPYSGEGAGHFAGPIHALDPKHDMLDGEAVFARAADLPQAPDLAVLCTPPATVAGLIHELGERGTRAAIVMSAGMDSAQKQATFDAARPYLLRLLGPNCLGLLSPHLGLNASFAHTGALPGDVAFVSQSGALVTAVLDWAKSRRIGFSHMVSLGESAAVDFGDLLDHLASDPRTRAILLYIESIKAPRKFMSAARAAARNKRVIVVKAGRAGKGVLAGSDLVFDAAIRRAGMLRVDTLQDLFMAAATLARFRGGEAGGPAAGIAPGPSPASKPLPGLARGLSPDRGLTLMSNGGGAGVMAADAAALAGITPNEPSAGLRGKLDALLPPTWSHANPIDIIGDAPVAMPCDGSSGVMLRGLEFGAVGFRNANSQCSHQSLHVAMPAQLSEPPAGIAQRAGPLSSLLRLVQHDASALGHRLYDASQRPARPGRAAALRPPGRAR